MPDFTARFTAGTVLAVWDDHQGGAASRLNPKAPNQHRYQKATVGVQVEIKATVQGVEGPTDAALMGLGVPFFTSDFAEHPCDFPILPTAVAGSSSVQQFTPPVAGHYLWVIRHTDGGAVALHFDVEP